MRPRRTPRRRFLPRPARVVSGLVYLWGARLLKDIIYLSRRFFRRGRDDRAPGPRRRSLPRPQWRHVWFGREGRPTLRHKFQGPAKGGEGEGRKNLLWSLLAGILGLRARGGGGESSRETLKFLLGRSLGPRAPTIVEGSESFYARPNVRSRMKYRVRYFAFRVEGNFRGRRALSGIFLLFYVGRGERRLVGVWGRGRSGA